MKISLTIKNISSGPIATIFTNTYGCRRVTIAGACLASLGFFISFFFTNLWVYYIAIGLIGGKSFNETKRTFIF